MGESVIQPDGQARPVNLFHAQYSSEVGRETPGDGLWAGHMETSSPHSPVFTLQVLAQDWKAAGHNSPGSNN